MAAALEEALGGAWPAPALEIATAPGGAPFAVLAPEASPQGGVAPGGRLPVAVSISHHEGRALCAAAFTGVHRRALGVDLGRIEPRSPTLLATFFTPDEQRFVAEGEAAARDLRANLIWCAKEAVLKVLGLGLTVDTLALTCLPEEAPADPGRWPLSPPGGAWRRLQARCGPALLPGGGVVEGVWRAFDGWVAVLAEDEGAALRTSA